MKSIKSIANFEYEKTFPHQPGTRFQRTSMHSKILFILLICALITHAPAFAEDESLTIITENWPPYNYAENGEVKGFSTEIVQSILKDLKLSFEIQILPGARGEKLLAEGSRVMNFSLFRTAARENHYKWIGPIAEDSIYFYKKKGNPLRIQTLRMQKMSNGWLAGIKGWFLACYKKRNLQILTAPQSRTGL